MGVAQTSQLLVELNLAGNFNSGIASAEGKLGGFGAAASGATAKAETFAARLSGGIGNALTTFKGRLESAAKGVALFAGVGGLLSIGGAVEQSIKKLEDFGLALEKVQTLTGETARDSGALILLFERFGLSTDQVGTFAGFAEKTLGKLNETTAKGAKIGKSAELQNLELIKNERVAAGESTKKIDLLIKEQKARDAVTAANTQGAASQTKLQALDAKYGLQLVDAKGKVVSYSEELRQLADFYDKNHDPATRAFVASTLLGRGYAALAPILDQGSAAIRRAAAEADQLGLGNADAAKKIADFRNTMRDLGVQVNILELQIGMALMPVVGRFATRITDFVSGHGPEIAKFFGDLGTFVEKTAGNIYDAAKTVGGFWNMIPPEFRDLLVKGIAADRTIKFLFGFDPAKLLMTPITNALSKLPGLGFLQRGSSPANPMWVQSAAGGVGGAPGAGGVGGILGTVGLLAGYASIAESLAAVPGTIDNFTKTMDSINTHDLPGAKSAFQNLIDSLPKFNPFINPALFQTGLDSLPNAPTHPSEPSLQPMTGPMKTSGMAYGYLKGTKENDPRALLRLQAREENLNIRTLLRTDKTQNVRDEALAAALARNLQPLPKKISDAQKAHFDAVRANAEANRIAIVSSQKQLGGLFVATAKLDIGQVIDRRGQTAQASANRIRDAVEANRIATVTRLGTLTARVDASRVAIVAGGRTGDREIVTAIKQNRPIISVVVNGRTVTTTYATGRSVSRTASTGSFNAGLTG